MGTLRLVARMARPGVAVVLLLFAALGQTQAGAVEAVHPLFTVNLVILVAWFVNATVLNDLADERIDRVNLAGDRERPLVSGDASRPQLLTVGLLAGVGALGVAWAVDPAVGAVVTGGLILNAAYSLPPVRLSHRGALAPLVLPAGYVAVPFLVGLLTIRPSVRFADVVLLAVLYVGFMGRIVLKDFRDVVGDERFGKRTFLLRHGRAATCAFSAGCWTVGLLGILWVVGAPVAVIAVVAVFLGVVLTTLGRLSHPARPSADHARVTAIAQLGRGAMVILLAQLTMAQMAWPAGPGAVVVLVIGAVFFDLYRTSARRAVQDDALAHDERVGELVVEPPCQRANSFSRATSTSQVLLAPENESSATVAGLRDLAS